MLHAGRSKKAARRTDRGGNNFQLDPVLLKIVDGGLAGCVFLVPLLMGGRQALGQLALVSLAVVVALAWTVRQSLRSESFWRNSSAELLLLAGLVLLVVQITPWSPSMLAWTAPHNAEILPLWTAQDAASISLGRWSCVSMTPAVTRAALSIFLAYGLLFLVTVQRIRTLEDVERLLRWIALSAVMMAVFGLVQLLTSNGKFFWFYEHPFSRTSDGAKGSFSNRNHFAHFLALGIGPLIWWLQHNFHARHKRRHRALGRLAKDFQSDPQVLDFRTLALGTVLFAGLMSLSRGGVSVMFVAAAICVAVCYRAKTLGNRFVLSLTAAAVLIGGLLTIHGLDQVSDRMGQLGSGSIDQLDRGGGRRTIWATVVKAIPDFALLGSGVGSHREVYPMYLENPPGAEFTHAENSPLQVLLETGVVGLTLVAAGIGFCMFWCLGGLRKAPSNRILVCAGAISASLTVSVAHSLVDFVWYVPACMALVAVLAGCACRTWQLAAEGSGKQGGKIVVPKPVAVAAAGLLLGAGAWMVGDRIGPTLAEPHWDRYRIMALAISNPTRAQQQQRALATPDQVYETSLEAIRRMIAELEQVVRYDPANAGAHLKLAAAYLRRFNHTQQKAENAMSLADIRDAAAKARAAARTRQQQEQVQQWLCETISRQGDYLHSAWRHARQGLRLCPLQGEGYLYLAELHFLQGPGDEVARPAYLAQALRVRPVDGAVLFEAGRAAVDRARKISRMRGSRPPDAQTVALMAKQFEQGMNYWRRSFRSGREHQARLIEALTGRVPVEYFVKTYQPDLYAMRLLRASYCRLGQPEQLNRLGLLYADRCRAEGRPAEGLQAAVSWLENQLAQLHHYYAQIARTEAEGLQGEEAARTWLEAAWFCHMTGDRGAALQCAQNAFRHDPNDYEVRYTLALRLIDDQQFAEAERHLSWCSRQRPSNEKLQFLVRETVKNRIDKESRTLHLAQRSRTPP